MARIGGGGGGRLLHKDSMFVPHLPHNWKMMKKPILKIQFLALYDKDKLRNFESFCY